MAIWYILWSCGIFSPVLVFCTKKNLATLLSRFRRLNGLWRILFGARESSKTKFKTQQGETKYAHMYVCMHICMYAHMYVCTYAHM
jgi:hypothetical protein